MANGKKSFKLYTDIIELVNGSNKHDVEIEPMTDEEAGQLFRWIIEYVNDLHPIVPKNIKYAVVQIKKQLDSDLDSYKEICRKNKENIEKRWNTKNNQSIPNNTSVYERIPNDTKNTDKDKDKDINNIVLSNSNELSNTSAAISQDISQAVIILPCLSNYNHPIFEEDIKHYKELYPAVNVLQELKKMLGWLESNPRNRKTKNGIKTFITRWLSKVQDKAPKVEDESNSFTGFRKLGEEDDFGGFQQLGETDEEYYKRTGRKPFGGNTL